jgi:hypothetical protein
MNATTRRTLSSLFRLRRWYRREQWDLTLLDARIRATLAAR